MLHHFYTHEHTYLPGMHGGDVFQKDPARIRIWLRFLRKHVSAACNMMMKVLRIM